MVVRNFNGSNFFLGGVRWHFYIQHFRVLIYHDCIVEAKSNEHVILKLFGFCYPAMLTKWSKVSTMFKHSSLLMTQVPILLKSEIGLMFTKKRYGIVEYYKLF